MESIKQRYEAECNSASDINWHLPTLYRYSIECDHITEMGIRQAVSTWAFLMGKPKKFVGYDINYRPIIAEVKRLAEEDGIIFEFKAEEVSAVTIEQTDLLFIDTWHVYEQIKKELKQHCDNVNKYIILHDTETFRYKDEEDYPNLIPPLVKTIKSPMGIWCAVVEFLQVHTEWKVKEHYINNNGLTILERI